MDNFGFIITRHVNSEITNKYWNHCIKCIRRFYPFKKIVIIDDNSNHDFLKAEFNYKNIEIIQSEFKGRGELLPYYYYLKQKYFENAIILHDSVFFHKRIHFEKLSNINVIPLWFFYADKENINNTLKIASKLKNSYEIYNNLSLNDTILGLKHLKWYGCYGVQSYINHNFLKYINEKYNIVNLIYYIHCRQDRCCLERIFGAIFFKENQSIQNKKSLLGNIMTYQKWGYSFREYENDIKKGKIPRAIIKVWTGR
jgi:hypothetical protein